MKYSQNRPYIFIIVFFLSFAASIGSAQKTNDIPEIFEPGLISTEAMETSASFTPDGKVVYFTRSDLQFADNTILVSHFKNGRWSRPEVASFSGVWRDSEPHVSPDGMKLFFVSNRPSSPEKQPLQTQRSTPGANIWYVSKTGDKWGEPVHIAGPVNESPMVYNPSVAKSGTLYFSGVLADGGGKSQIYRSVLIDGVYGKPERLSFSDTQWNFIDPYIAPDERFILFASNRQGAIGNVANIYISFRNGGTWSEPVNLGAEINTPFAANAPSLAPDGKTLYFSSIRRKLVNFPKPKESYSDVEKRLQTAENGSRNIWRIDISKWLENFGKL